jgi:NAD(P)-dependent dehydrogenase (short-subunit alcohol dehydrogenase family)
MADPDDIFSIVGKTALVTGGTSGIGLMIARTFVERGAKVYICSRDPESCKAVAAELSQHGTCIAKAADLSTTEGIDAVAAWITTEEGRLDILVNNAGVNQTVPLDDFSEAAWDMVVDLNLKSVFFLTQKLLPCLRAAAGPQSPASVINISSVGAMKAYPAENYPYGASKAGLQQLTKHLALRLGPEHIAVNAIAPGYFPSRMSTPTPEKIVEVSGRVPMRRVGNQTDAGGLAVFLASPAGSYLCGVVIPLDGGMLV